MDNYKRILVVVICAFVVFPAVHSVFKDVVFVVDRSASIATSDLRIGLEFVYNVSNWLTIGPHDIEVSLVTFSDDPNVEIGLGTNTDHKSLMNALRYITTVGMESGGTNTEKALRCVEYIFECYGRWRAKKVVVILTDGVSSNTDYTIRQANHLRQRLSASIFAVGIGSAVMTSNRELRGLASNPASYYLHKVNQFIYLCNLIPSIVPKLDPDATAKAIANCPKPPSTFDINNGITVSLIAESVAYSTSRDQGINTGLIAGIATAAAVAVLSGAVAFALMIRRKCLSNKLVPETRTFPMTGNYVNAPNGQPNARNDLRTLR